MTTAAEAKRVWEEADCIYTKQQVDAALDKMAADISARLGDSDPLVLCVVTGAIISAGHLLTRLDFPLTVDYIHATRYRGATEGGRLHWLAQPHSSLKGRTILIVDDILDEGITLAGILEYCGEQGAADVFSAVLIDKQHNRKNELRADFVGLVAEDRYLFGFGMDYMGYLRNAPGIYAVKGM